MQEEYGFFPHQAIPEVVFFNYETQIRAGVALCHTVARTGHDMSILLAGLPGTGKSSFPYALANRVRNELGIEFSLGHVKCDAIATQNNVSEKLDRIIRVVNLAEENQPSLLVFDDIDRITGIDATLTVKFYIWFRDFIAQRHAGVLMIGIANAPQEVDSSLFRRFQGVIHFQPTNIEIVEGMIRHLLDRKDSDEIAVEFWRSFERLRLQPQGAQVLRACDYVQSSMMEDTIKEISVNEIVRSLVALSGPVMTKEEVEKYERLNSSIIKLSTEFTIPYWNKVYADIIGRTK